MTDTPSSNAPRTSRAKRHAAIVVFLVALGLASVLGWSRIGRMEVELDVKASELSFEARAVQASTSHLALRYFGLVEPAARVVWPASRSNPRRVLTNERIALRSAPGETGEIFLHGIEFPAQSVRLRNVAASVFELEVTGVSRDVLLTLRGSMQCPGSRDEICDFDRPRTVVVTPRDGRLRMEFEIMDAPVTFATRVVATNLDFSHVYQSAPETTALLRRASTVQSGRIYFESLNGEELALRSFQRLDLAGVDGVIRRLDLGPDGITVNYIGRVTGMKTGVRSAERNLMPTYLTWLRERRALALIWGATLFLVGLAETVAKLWR